MITKSSIDRWGGSSSERPRRSLESPPRLLRPLSGLVDMAMDLPSHLSGQSGHTLELLAACGEEALRRAEVLQDHPLARRPDAGEVVQHGARHRPVAAAA